MNTLALVLVLAAALAHATWNLLSKKAAGSPRFVWIYCTVAAVLYAPLALVVALFRPQPFGFLQAIFVLGSAPSPFQSRGFACTQRCAGFSSIDDPLQRLCGGRLAITPEEKPMKKPNLAESLRKRSGAMLKDKRMGEPWMRDSPSFQRALLRQEVSRGRLKPEEYREAMAALEEVERKCQ